MSQTLTTERLWTYDEACAELEEQNSPLEIWHGHLVMSPTPTFFHQVIVSRVEEKLRAWVRRHRLGLVVAAPLDVVLEPDLVLQPDVMFIAKRRTTIIKQHIHGAPDLVVEVVSPDRRRRDYKEKKDAYEGHGVQEYWIVDPTQKHIEVWSLNEDYFELLGRFVLRQQAASKLLDGFKIRVDEIFVEPLKI
ncbi:MAG: Uma2 family endonuclease [Verrucomicrobiota bacterium]